MGTPAMTTVYDEDGAEICTIYTQCDGFPHEQGKELAEFLFGRKVIAGYGAADHGKISNGMEELAAQLLTELKCRYPRGHIYLVPRKKWGAEWEYQIRFKDDRLRVTVKHDDRFSLKAANPAELLEWCVNGKGSKL